MKLFLLGTGHPPIRRLIVQAQPLMDDFSREQRQSCHLVVPEQGCGIIIAQSSPVDNWELRAHVGARPDLFATGSGLTLLAFQHPERLSDMLRKWGVSNSDGRLSGLRDELAEVRRSGARMAPSGQAIGVTDLSCPIRGPNGDAVAALTCAYIEYAGDTQFDRRSQTLSRLSELARTLSLDLQHRGTGQDDART